MQLGLGLGLTLGAGGGSSVGPTLILDFVGPSTSGASIDMSFVTEPLGAYSVYTPDASQPQAGFINIQVWN